jgi:hypothetical protein
MAIMIHKPQLKVVPIPATDSLACSECGHCKLAKRGLGGACYHPDNKQDAQGTIPELITDTTLTAGHCSGFVYRAKRVSVGE